MLKIVLATSNPHKVDEINKIFESLEVEFVLPIGDFDPIEDADTFEGNALIKAKAANKVMNMLTLADDSGLCVDALDGAPGLHSARYAENQTGRIERLLSELKDFPEDKRSARFVCAMVLLDKNGNVLLSTRGECEGKIGFTPKGTNGFGYDPIFIVDGNDITMAEMAEDVKNKISHRAIALQNVINFIKNSKNNF